MPHMLDAIARPAPSLLASALNPPGRECLGLHLGSRNAWLYGDPCSENATVHSCTDMSTPEYGLDPPYRLCQVRYSAIVFSSPDSAGKHLPSYFRPLP